MLTHECMQRSLETRFARGQAVYRRVEFGPRIREANGEPSAQPRGPPLRVVQPDPLRPIARVVVGLPLRVRVVRVPYAEKAADLSWLQIAMLRLRNELG